MRELGPASYLLILLLPLGLAALLVRRGVAPALGSLAATALGALVLSRLERWRPARTAWLRGGPDVPVDAAHLGVGSALAGGLHLAVLRLGACLLAGQPGPWPGGLPLIPQVALALVIVEFGQYGAHAALHRVPWLWPLHAVHHSPARLYWLNTFRNHPLDTLLTVVCPGVPLALLGASELVISLTGLLVGVHGMMQHANVRFREGPLTYVLSTATLHRWHHDGDLAHAQGNYGGTLILWDLLFRTRRAPAGEGPQVLGLAGGEPIAERYLAQLAYPFRTRVPGGPTP